MGTGIKMGGGSILKILNGILGQYYADTTDINANTFIEFITNKSILNSISDSGGYMSSGSYVTGTMLTDTSFVILGTGGSNTYALIAVAGNVSGNTITFGTPVTVASNGYGIYSISIDKISTTSVLVSYLNRSSSTGSQGAAVLSVSGNTITVGKILTFGTVYNPALDAVASTTVSCVLSSSKAFVTYAGKESTYDSRSKLFGAILNISGTTVTLGGTSVIHDGTTNRDGGYVDSFRNLCSIAISSTQIVTLYNCINGSTYVPIARVCTISGNALSRDSILNCPGTNAKDVTLVKASSTRAYYIYYTTVNSYYETPNIAVMSINGNTMSIGTVLAAFPGAVLYASQTSYCPITTTNSSATFSMYTCDPAGGRVIRTYFTVSGTTITKNSSYNLTTPFVARPMISMMAGSLEVTFGREQLAVSFLRPGTYIKEATSNIEGLLINKATSSKLGKVYTLRK